MTVIPLASRQSVRERTGGRCLRCGGNGAHWHHRRSRRVVDEHTHCACNGVWLCARCHSWAHHHPTKAKAEGYIVPPQFFPYLVPVWSFATWWLLNHTGDVLPVNSQHVVVDECPSLAFETQQE